MVLVVVTRVVLVDVVGGGGADVEVVGDGCVVLVVGGGGCVDVVVGGGGGFVVDELVDVLVVG